MEGVAMVGVAMEVEEMEEVAMEVEEMEVVATEAAVKVEAEKAVEVIRE